MRIPEVIWFFFVPLDGYVPPCFYVPGSGQQIVYDYAAQPQASLQYSDRVFPPIRRPPPLPVFLPVNFLVRARPIFFS